MRLPLVLSAAVAAVLFSPPAHAGTDDHRYKQGEHVELWVNKVRFFVFNTGRRTPKKRIAVIVVSLV